MRYECADFPGCFVEYGDSWTRGELREIADPAENARRAWAVAMGKVTAVHLERVGEDAISDPTQLDSDPEAAIYDSMDSRLYEWLALSIWIARAQVTQAGNAVAASLLRSIETAQAAA